MLLADEQLRASRWWAPALTQVLVDQAMLQSNLSLLTVVPLASHHAVAAAAGGEFAAAAVPGNVSHMHAETLPGTTAAANSTTISSSSNRNSTM